MPDITEVLDDAAACHAYGCQILMARGDPAIAEKLFRRAVQLDSGLAGGWQALGVLLLRTADARAARYVEAEACLRRAVALNPTVDGYAQLGQVVTYQGRLAEAADPLARAAEMDPRNPTLALQAGKAFAEREDYAEARLFFERCLETDPECAEARSHLQSIATFEKYRAHGNHFSRWPVNVRDFRDLEDAVRKFVLAGQPWPKILLPATAVATLGSCFAGNLANALRDLGHAARNLTVGEIANNTYANRAYLEWVLGRDGGMAEEALRKALPSDVPLDRAHHAGIFQAAGIVIFTLGVAPCFFDRQGRPAFIGDGMDIKALCRDYAFRTTTVEENVANLEAILAAVRALNPQAWLVLSVSPVPLAATLEYPSAVIADCVSKSTLRVAADQFLREGHDRVVYWPSYEIVRWLAPYVGGMFGGDDGVTSHVSRSVVDLICRLFVENFAP